MDAALHKYFPELSDAQWSQLEHYAQVIEEWNARINVVSRKDIEHLGEKHILPSIAISKVIQFAPGAKVLDVGTGGGFPGIPLAICFPETQFLLVDSVGKKIKVVQAAIDALGLKNARAQQVRAETLTQSFDFVIGRAVTQLPRFLGWIKGKVKQGKKGSRENGLIYLKGGDFDEELAAIDNPRHQLYDLDRFFDGKYCETKKVLYLPRVWQIKLPKQLD